MEAVGYKSIAFSYSGDAVIFFNDGRELSVPGYVAEKLLQTRAEEGLPPIPVTRATSPEPVADDSDLTAPDTATTRQWKVTLGCQVDEVTNDSRFSALFEAALDSDPQVDMIHFGGPSLPHGASAVLLVSATEMTKAEVLGMDILKRNLHVAAQAIVGDKPYGRALQVQVEPFPSQTN